MISVENCAPTNPEQLSVFSIQFEKALLAWGTNINVAKAGKKIKRSKYKTLKTKYKYIGYIGLYQILEYEIGLLNI